MSDKSIYHRRTLSISDIEFIIEKLPNATQLEIAELYAQLILKGTPETEYEKVNAAIEHRWSASGRNRIKEMAWKIVDAEKEKANVD